MKTKTLIVAAAFTLGCISPTLAATEGAASATPGPASQRGVQESPGNAYNCPDPKNFRPILGHVC